LVCQELISYDGFYVKLREIYVLTDIDSEALEIV
jgi:hypothetical protein